MTSVSGSACPAGLNEECTSARTLASNRDGRAGCGSGDKQLQGPILDRMHKLWETGKVRRHEFMIGEWVAVLILLGAHGCDMLEVLQNLDRTLAAQRSAVLDFTMEEGMSRFRCWSLSCFHLGQAQHLPTMEVEYLQFWAMTVKEMPTTASQLLSTCSFGQHPDWQQLMTATASQVYHAKSRSGACIFASPTADANFCKIQEQRRWFPWILVVLLSISSLPFTHHDLSPMSLQVSNVWDSSEMNRKAGLYFPLPFSLLIGYVRQGIDK